MKLKKELQDAWEYVKESRYYIYATTLIFACAALLSFSFSEQFTFLDRVLQALIAETEGLSTPKLITYIFFNNLQSSALGLFPGVVFGAFPVFTSLINGFVVGYVLQRTYDAAGIWEFWRLLPHGIFELPAVFISLGLGVRLGFFMFAKNKKRAFIERSFSSIRVFLLIVIPLLLIGAVIEGVLINLYK